MLNRIKQLCKQNGIPISRLEEETGISRNSIGRWEQSVPSVDKVQKVAEYFNVSLDWLVSGRDVLLSDQSSAILRKWAKLDDFGKALVTQIMDGEIERSQRIRDLSDIQRTVPMLRSLQPASAGTGIEIGIADMEIVFVDDTPETRKANFIVAVRGDSMLPIYQDGDQLLIERAEDVGIGEIGLFVVNGQGFVKQRGASELVSLNKEYNNIPISSETVCNGKVIGILKKSDVK